MKMPESFFSRAILAYLPFMAYLGADFNIWRIAGWVVVYYWVMLLIFWPLRKLLPPGGSKQIFFLWLVLSGQWVWQVAGLPPFWTLSVFLLFPIGFLEKKGTGRQSFARRRLPKYFSERIMTGIGFFLFCWLLGTARALLDWMPAAASPAGIFLLLFFGAFLWKNRPFSGAGMTADGKKEAGS